MLPLSLLCDDGDGCSFSLLCAFVELSPCVLSHAESLWSDDSFSQTCVAHTILWSDGPYENHWHALIIDMHWQSAGFGQLVERRHSDTNESSNKEGTKLNQEFKITSSLSLTK